MTQPTASPRARIRAAVASSGVRHRLVRLDGRLCEMPRPAVGLVRPHLGQHAVRGSTFFGMRQVHDGRAHQRVVEREPVCCLVHVRESCLLRRREIAKAGVRRRSPPQDAHVSGAIERHAQQELTRPRRKLGDPRSEERLEASTERQRGRQRLGGCAHPRAERNRELQQRERVPLGLDQDTFANGRRELGEPAVEQLPRRHIIEPRDLQLGKSGVIEEVHLPRPRCTEQPDLAARQAPRDEAQHARARPVQPGQVVEDDEHRSCGGGLAKQHERRIRHDEPAGGRAVAEAERDVEGVSVDRRELWQRAQEREEKLVQTGEARPGLELDAGSAEDAHARGRRRLRRGVQEDGLADTGLAGHEQGSAVGPGRGEERADAVHLRLAPDQLTGLATVALPSVVLRRVDVVHRRYP